MAWYFFQKVSNSIILKTIRRLKLIRNILDIKMNKNVKIKTLADKMLFYLNKLKLYFIWIYLFIFNLYLFIIWLIKLINTIFIFIFNHLLFIVLYDSEFVNLLINLMQFLLTLSFIRLFFFIFIYFSTVLLYSLLIESQ